MNFKICFSNLLLLIIRGIMVSLYTFLKTNPFVLIKYVCGSQTLQYFYSLENTKKNRFK